MRLRPYRHGDHVLLDVQQVIPLPEAADYQVRVREKVQRERVARQAANGRDYTKLIVTTPQGVRGPLPKRRAILEVVKGLISAGIPPLEIGRILQNHHRYGDWTLASAPDDLDRGGFIAAMAAEGRASGRTFDPVRFFCKDEELIRSGGRTYALTNQWGTQTIETIEALLKAFPDQGISFAPTDAVI